MKIKKLISAFCLAAGLALSVPALSSTLGVPQTMSTVSAAEDGWYQDANGWYYLQGDTRLVGLQKIGNATYYFDANGYRVTGSVKIGKYNYFFRPDNGKLNSGVSGLAQFGDKNVYYYFTSSKKGIVASSKWVKTKGRYYYADATGQIKLGTIKVGSKLYHITKTGRLTSYKKSTYDNKYYYAGSNGVLKTGLRKIGKRLYYFNTKTGARQSGTLKVGKYTYHFNTQSGYARTGWVKLKDSAGKYQWYYFDKNCRRLSGFQTISKKKYYLDPTKNDARVQNGWYKIGSYYYYFNSKGVLQTGFITISGKTYYTTGTGIRKKGWQTVNGRKYYMDSKTAVMQTGWLTYNNKKYYLNPVKTSSTYGAAKTGFVKISGSWYYFNSDGTMRTGWLLDNMKYYYFDTSTGKMLTGTHKIDGKTYNFGSSGAIKANISGSWEIHVNRKQNCVTIYKGGTAVKAMICSTAKNVTNTPTGTFKLLDKLRWHELNGPSWGQYCSHITSDILFHSVTYTRYNDNRSLNISAYNNLGQPASGGCIRLQVIDAKWMYENCPVGTKVVISDKEAMPLGKPSRSYTGYWTGNYDPTDPAI